jgi:hypothetical protein
LESTHPTDYSFILVLFTFGLFVVAALLEIGGGYMVWQWLREKRKPLFGLIGGAHTVFIRNDPNVSAIKFWSIICCLWWNICGDGNSIGIGNRQKKARQI